MKLTLAVLLTLAGGSAFAADSISSFSDAKRIWNATKDRGEYQAYAAEFAQFNNHFQLDTKDGCYALGNEPVELMLVIVHREGEQYASIERVLSSAENAKAQCFKKSYTGVPTKAPPFYPFVLQLGMGASGSGA